MKKWISLLLALTLCAGLAAPALAAETEAASGPAFSDVPPEHYAWEAVGWCASRGVAAGYGDGTFHPGEAVSRAGFLAMLAGVFCPEAAASGEAGQAADSWRPEEALARKGFLQGLGWKESELWPRNLDPELTRYEMALLLYNIMAANFRSVSASNQIAVRERIPDWTEVPERYAVAVAGTYAEGILNGLSDGRFGGGGLVSRAQGCAAVYRLARYLGVPVAPVTGVDAVS